MRLFTALCLVLIVSSSAFAVNPDPPPIVDDRLFIGAQIVAPQTVCENGVCRVVTPSAAQIPVAVVSSDCACGASCPCSGGAASVATVANRSEFPMIERVRSWYPGKLFQRWNANRVRLFR